MTSSGDVAVRTQSLYGAMLPSQHPSRGRRLRWLVSLVAMWGFLAYPVSDVLRRGLPGAARATVLALLAVFAVVWLRTMWLSVATTTAERRILPWFAAAAGIGVPLAFALGSVGFDALFIYLSIAAAVSLPLPATLPGLLVCTAAAGAQLARIRPGVGPGVAFGQLSYVFWLGAMMLFYRRMMLMMIELRQARVELARMAVTDERLRIARDLHDLLGHSLSTISLKAQLARRLTARDSEASAEIADIVTVAGHALTEVREAVTGYRRTSLASELDCARAALDAARIEVSVELAALGLPAAEDALLGWVLREGVTNVLRHSRARRCTVQLSRGPDGVQLRVADDGQGPLVGGTAGNGLTGLGERLEAAGGRLHFGAAGALGTGFALTATLPLAVMASAGPVDVTADGWARPATAPAFGPIS